MNAAFYFDDENRELLSNVFFNVDSVPKCINQSDKLDKVILRFEGSDSSDYSDIVLENNKITDANCNGQFIFSTTNEAAFEIIKNKSLTKVQFEFFQADNETELYTLILNEEEQAIFRKAINCLIN